MASDDTVKRYDCTDGGSKFCHGCYTMTECEYGDYVAWEDFDAMRQRAEKAELDSAINLADGLRSLLPDLDDALEDLELHGCHDQQGYRKLKDWFRKVEIHTRVIDAALAKREP